MDDLKIFGKPGSQSVFDLYNNTYTRGGADILENMFLHPLSDAETINNRSKIIQLFAGNAIKFPFKTEDLDSAEMYLGMTDERTMLSQKDDTLSRKFSQLISADGDYKVIYNGITAITVITQTITDLVSRFSASAKASAYQEHLDAVIALLTSNNLSALIGQKPVAKLPFKEVADTDKLLRFQKRREVKELLTFIYQLDVFISIAEVAQKQGYVFPVATGKGVNTVELTNVYHPLVKNAKANTINITPTSNIVFLTGANMAGKSTFMKSLGIALYLAHMGFPVAAAKMKFSVRDGIFTTINLPDDLGSGNSHFYAEVLRVKKIAKELSTGKNLFIIFDELFRGTNVKDAYEGTIAITQAFAEKRNCMFVVSTHIIETGELLKQSCPNINFVYLPTHMDKNTPVYTYTLESGITADRHGMIIINNERILEIIRSRKNNAI